jgi:alpha-galactosidase
MPPIPGLPAMGGPPPSAAGSTMSSFAVIDRLPKPKAAAAVYESGWQSWSPSGLYRLDQAAPRPSSARVAAMSYRPDQPPQPGRFQGEGLLLLELPDQRCRVWSAVDVRSQVATIRLSPGASCVEIAADGPVVAETVAGSPATVLARHFARLGAQLGVASTPVLFPGVWCSWGFHRHGVLASDVDEAADQAEGWELPIEVFLVDDGWQLEIGDWRPQRPGFGDLRALARRLHSRGLRLGLWLAPFLVGSRSGLAQAHSRWLVDGPSHPRCWGQGISVLDPTDSGAGRHLQDQFRRLCELGCSYFKLDFLYAGAWPGRRRHGASPLEAYRHGLQLIRAAVGPQTTLVGCGAPLLASVGLVDAMRVSPDIALHREPAAGDLSQPSLTSALHTGRARAPMHQRLWVNDPDMLLARPRMPNRDLWAEHVARMGGVVASGDRLSDLDPHGIALLRDALQRRSHEPVRWRPACDVSQGTLG